MSKIKYIYYLLFALIFTFACQQEQITYERPVPENPPPGPEPSAGNADFSKFVAVGNSLTAGFQAGALFTAGQQHSLPAILNQQFKLVGGGDFNQPDINSANGFNATFYNPQSSTIPGRLVLAGNPPAPTPTAGELIKPFEGDRTDLNNFAVPGTRVLDALYSGYASVNPYFGRMASSPDATMIGDAAAAQGTFFLMWLGSNDVLGYAISGGAGYDGETDPSFEGNPQTATVTLTSTGSFSAAYQAALGAMAANPTVKGIVANIPDVTTVPFFTTIPYNAITLDTTTANALMAPTAYGGFNAALNGLVQAGQISQAEADKRKISFAAGANPIVIKDEDLADLGPALASINEHLAAYGQIRQTVTGELVLLTAATVLPTGTGTQTPAADPLVLTSNEITLIEGRTAAFNNIIANAVSQYGDRIALVDINTTSRELAMHGGFVDSVAVNASFAPPYGLYSEDGVHPNTRGYAYTANIFIDAINQKFGAVLPKVDIGDYAGTGLPVQQP